MKIAGICGRCGDRIREGDFCYRLGGAYWCRDCVNHAAVIAAGEGRRNRFDSREGRQTGRYRERELVPAGYREGESGICRRSGSGK